MGWGLKESKDYIESLPFINGVATIELDVQDGTIFTNNPVPTVVSVENVQNYINDIGRSCYFVNMHPIVSLAGKKPRPLIRDLEKQIISLQSDLVRERKEKNDLKNSLQYEKNRNCDNESDIQAIRNSNSELRNSNSELEKDNWSLRVANKELSSETDDLAVEADELRKENVELKKKIDEMGKGGITKDGMSFETFDDYIEVSFKTKVHSINDFHDTMTVLKRMLNKNGA
jgi:hypothetical protein